MLPMFGYVMGQEDDANQRFDPYAITHRLQSTIVSYYSQPPRDARGYTKFLAMLGYRQGGKSTTAELAAMPAAMYTPGWDHLCLADVNFRADYLHGRVQYAYQRWDEQVRPPKVHVRESRSLTVDPKIGGVMRVLSMQSGATGIGQSPNSTHWSEVPFCLDAAKQWTYLLPAVRNKKNALVLLESTPAPASEPSTAWWRSVCYDAKKGKGRWVYAFFPYWDGKLNRDEWLPSWVLDNDEIRLLERYGPEGMTKEHLAFRRITLDSDPHIRLNPDLFDVFYPRDDITCWLAATTGVIHPDILRPHAEGVLVPWDEEKESYKEYRPVNPGAMYVVGVDPTGYGTRDHASFQVLEVWDGDWDQAAVYAWPIGDPNAFTDKLIEVAKKYNNAYIVVESTGVGVAVLALLLERGYRNIFFEARNKPGRAASTKAVEQNMSYLIEALKDELTLHDKDTVDQLGSYQNDKLVEEAPRAEHLRGLRPMRSRRPRHHWDKVSALMYAVFGARQLPQRRRPERKGEVVYVPFGERSYTEQQAIVKAMEPRPPERKRARYTSVRRRGRK